jgi:hypothetical protein
LWERPLTAIRKLLWERPLTAICRVHPAVLGCGAKSASETPPTLASPTLALPVTRKNIEFAEMIDYRIRVADSFRAWTIEERY